MTFGNTVKDGSGTAYWLLVDSSGRLLMSGAAAEDAAASGNPLLMGALYSSAPATVQTGDAVRVLSDANGRIVVSGAAAHDAAAVGNPHRVAGVYHSTAPTGTDGDVLDLLADVGGRLIVKPYFAGKTATQVTADGNIKASAGTLFGITYTGVGVTAADTVVIKDGGAGGTVIFTFTFTAANETHDINFGPVGIAFAGAIYADVTISGGAVYVTGIYE